MGHLFRDTGKIQESLDHYKRASELLQAVRRRRVQGDDMKNPRWVVWTALRNQSLRETNQDVLDFLRGAGFMPPDSVEPTDQAIRRGLAKVIRHQGKPEWRWNLTRYVSLQRELRRRSGEGQQGQ
jgi:hypothetical protein